jgi:RNA polymerase sigma factor (sigma-70 family)
MDINDQVKANLGLVRHTLQPFRKLPAEDLADLRAVALEALWYAIRDHAPERGPFGPYAVMRIRYLIGHKLRHDQRRMRGSGISPIRFSALRHEDGVDFIDTLEDARPGHEELVNARITAESALARMDPREQRIFRLRAQGYTLRELMPIVGASYQRAQQLEARARKRLIF